jgi:hypothetical protein
MTANSPATPGNFHDGTGDTAGCAKSTCEFTITTNSSIIATFDGNPVASLSFDLLGDGEGNIGRRRRRQDLHRGLSSHGYGNGVRLSVTASATVTVSHGQGKKKDTNK